MLPKTLAISATILWLMLIIILALIWWGLIPTTMSAMVIPYLILLLSVYVFNRTPSLFRRIHHWFVWPTLLLTLGFSYNFAFHGGEQGGVGAYLLTYSVFAAYLIFISLFLSALAIRKFRSKS